MKKLLLLLSFLPLYCLGQDSSSLQSFIHIYSQLSRTDMHTSLLYDRAGAFSSMQYFDGIYDTITNYHHWEQMYYELQHADLDSNIVAIDTIQKWADTDISSYGRIPIGIVNFQYDAIKYGAIDSNYLQYDSVDNLLTDVPGRTGNPYEEDQVFAATPLTDFVSATSTAFYVSNNYIFSNRPALTNMQIDFGDGNGYVNVSPGNTYNVSYSTTGPITISLKATIPGVGDRVTKTNITVRPFIPNQGEGSVGDFISPIQADIPFTPAGGSAIYATGVFARRSPPEVGNPSHQRLCINKPIIIMDGIDFKFRRSCPNNRCGDLGWADLLNPPADYPQLQNMPGFINTLITNDYDVFFLDNEKGANYIEANAMLLVKLINMINAQKCTCEGIAIVGPSMGGQVAKYALSYMEKNNMEHDVRLYASFDSPHQGANIPIGAQEFLNFYAEESRDAEEALRDELQSPAARELLVSYYTNPGHPDPLRTSFMTNLANLGTYPSLPRKIAVSNGSTNGTGQSFNEGDQLIQYNYTTAIVNIKGNAWAAPGITLNGTQRVVFQGQKPTGQNTFSIVSLPSNATAIDNAPGGIDDRLKKFAGAQRLHSPGILSIFGVDSVRIGFVNVLHQQYCFIPSISALDVFNNPSLTMDIGTPIHTGKPQPTLYPFDDYLPHNDNQLHVDVTTQNTNWFLDQLSSNEYNLTATLPDAINGSTYNFGRTRNQLHDLTVNSGGTLQVNGNYDADFGGGDPAIANSTFTVYTTCNSTVDIESGGNLIVGDEGTGYTNVGILDVRSGCTLVVNGHLILHQNSKVIIEKDADIVFNNGGDIQLLGSNAVLEIRGSLHVGDNAIFTLNTSSTGFIRFYQEYPTAVNAYAGSNSSILLQSSGTDPSNKVLEVAGGESFYPNDNFAMVTIQNARVELANNCRLNIGCPLTLNNVKITSTADGSGNYVYNAHRGLNIYGQGHIVGGVGSSTVSITGLEIDNGLYGIYAVQTDGGYGTTLYNTSIFNCETGIHSEGESLTLDYSGSGNASLVRDFSTVGWVGTGMSGTSTLSHSEFYQSSAPSGTAHDGVDFTTGTTGVSLYVDESKAKYCSAGLNITGTVLTMLNSRFVNNVEGIYAENSSINLNGLASPAGGGNDLGNNSEAGIYMRDQNNSDRSSLDLNNGYNNFAGNSVEIEGQVGQSTGGTNCDGGHHYLANYNTWNSTSGPANNSGDLNIYCPDNNQIYPYILEDDNDVHTFIGTYSGPDNSPAFIGNQKKPEDEFAGLIGDNQPQLKDAVVSAMQYLHDEDYTNAVHSFDNIIRSNCVGKITDERLLQKLYSKMIYATEQSHGIHDANADVLAEETIQLQEALTPGNKVANTSYAMAFNICSDKAGLYRLINDRKTAIRVIDDLKSWSQPEDIEKLDYKRCYFVAEDSIQEGVTKREEFARLVQPCVPPKKHIHKFAFSTVDNMVQIPSGNMLLYPNPASGNINLIYNAAGEGTMSFTVMSADGRVMDQVRNNSFTKGNNSYTVSTETYAPGVYFISANVNGKEYRQKFVVTR